jgi:WD40 repeat protein
MSLAASGQGAAAAAEYSADEPGPHRLVLLTTPGAEYNDWNGLLPDLWLPASISETELVVLIGAERERNLGSASYDVGPDITAYQYETDMEVREARTGRTVRTFTYTGTDPRPFPVTAPVPMERIEGSHLTYGDLEDWLCPSVAPRTCWLPLRTLEWQPGGVTAVAFSPDGQILALGSPDGNVRLWRVSDGSLAGTLAGHADAVSSVAFSPDGQTLASGSWDNSVRLWRVADGSLLLTRELSPPRDAEYQGWLGNVNSVAFSPDGQTLAAGLNDETVRLWRLPDGSPLRTLEVSPQGDDSWRGCVNSVAFSPDGQTLASGSNDGTAILWRVADGVLLHTMPDVEGSWAPTGSVKSVAFSPDGQTLASGSDDGAVRLWRTSDGSLARTLKRERDPVSQVNAVAFSPDGQTLASGSTEVTVRLWQVSDGRLARTLAGHPWSISAVAFSPVGQMLASTSGDGTVRLWQVAPPAPTATPRPARTPTAGAPRAKPVATAAPSAPTLSPACQNALARLTEPAPDARVSGVVPIVGTANTADFAFYKVQFIPERLYPDGPWGELYQSTTPVVNGTLMTWHTGTVPPGVYWLRLLVHRHDGNYPPPCELRLVVTR